MAGWTLEDMSEKGLQGELILQTHLVQDAWNSFIDKLAEQQKILKILKNRRRFG